MTKKTHSGWIVTAPWYDEPPSKYCGDVERTKNEAIRRFREFWTNPKTWRQYKREGWRVTQATVTWD